MTGQDISDKGQIITPGGGNYYMKTWHKTRTVYSAVASKPRSHQKGSDKRSKSLRRRSELMERS